ncbi:hypothetical protein [Meleagrid alphaherpesvirus 1]|uniref:Uncharacterized protein HVT084 n=1 Tax=Meleagrid herpesvirus 1 TaxID=37108 RepID=Q9DPP5_MEHV1|nr:hypothetical protein [Meleagrid alphaherpesvirus 1]
MSLTADRNDIRHTRVPFCIPISTDEIRQECGLYYAALDKRYGIDWQFMNVFMLGVNGFLLVQKTTTIYLERKSYPA